MSEFIPLPPPPPDSRGRSGGHQRQRNNRRGGGYNRNKGGRGRGRGRGRGAQQREINQVLEELGSPSESSLCVAVQGCSHGELDAIYDSLKTHQERTGRTVDLLLCCGDFQSLRNSADFQSLAVPPKYRSLGSFCRYYSGERVAPVLTIFVGGNHEASQPLQELYYGGWVAPNIYYLGAAGVVRFGGIRIGGISGIYKKHDYKMGRFERPPYNHSTLRSIYHVRNVDVFRLKSLSFTDRLDVMLSHDWPQGIEQHGNTADLLRRKPYFRSEIQRNELGSPPNFELLQALKPKWWFAAHLHVKFAATVRHPSLQGAASPSNESAVLVPSQVKQPNLPNDSRQNEHPAAGEIDPDFSLAGAEDPVTTRFQSLESSVDGCNIPSLTEQMTQFLSLDKCLPRRHYLSIVHIPTKIPPNSPIELEYDVEWLSILKKTHHLTNAQRKPVHLPDDVLSVTEEEKSWVKNRILLRGQDAGIEAERNARGSLSIPRNFCPTVPPHNDPSFPRSQSPYEMMGNPQTDELLELLELDHIVTVPYTRNVRPAKSQPRVDVEGPTTDDNEIDLQDEESSDAAVQGEPDPDEIPLDDLEEFEDSEMQEKEEGSKRARIQELND